MDKKTPLFEQFVSLIKTLRGPNGCPWDKEQTFESLMPCIIEEAYELIDTIQSRDMMHLKEELGDALLHVVMLSNMAEEKGLFDINDVIDGVSSKMIRRHPHVFKNQKVDSVKEVLNNWESIKSGERKGDSILSDLPNALPAALLAQKIQERVAKVGFDWANASDVIQKVNEETTEVSDALRNEDQQQVEEEIGDLLFTVVNLARKTSCDPEIALRKANQKFTSRFQKLEALAKTNDQHLDELSIQELESLWQDIKSQESI